MALVSRLAGAILVEGAGRVFLVGDTKRPCDWAAEGFQAPADVNPLLQPLLELRGSADREQAPGEKRGPSHKGPFLLIATEDVEALCLVLHERLLIERNASVSERLWNLILDGLEDEDADFTQPVAIDWLLSIPSPVWTIVRESLLKCV